MSEDKKVGRPLKFQSVEEMQEKIDAYFAECDKKEDPYTITGLALALNTSRQTLLDYQDKSDEYFDTLKKAKTKCENYAEKHLFKGKNGVVGAIFNLKNNYSWVDKQEIDNKNSNNLNINLGDLSDEERERRINELKDKLK
ncbi:terminase small subunit [Metabacillus halosaccharovorans]|uniref:terminase small subunit n=1 Tax=Metabacillus halosaccharovorans TaxID=930124 RepID=UPI0034CEF1A7